MTDTPEHFKVPTPLLFAVARYLAQRPYSEVADLIAGLEQAEPFSETEPEQQTP